MELQIKELRKKDYNKIIYYAIKGMHFNMYLDNKIALNLYGRYFWYLELTNATQVISAFKESVGIYDKTNKEILDKYKSKNNPDGEIRILVANPDIKVKGIGILLLNELEKREKGKEIYLFTDDQCTYQFYEHRGFDRVREKDIQMDINKKKVPLKCLLYRKKIRVTSTSKGIEKVDTSILDQDFFLYI